MKFTIKDFEVDDNTVLRCPRGYIPIESHIVKRSSTYYAKFEAKNCCRCDAEGNCCAYSQGKYYIVRAQDPKKIVPQWPSWVKKLQSSIPKDHSLYIPEKGEINEAFVIGSGTITEYAEGGKIKSVKPMHPKIYKEYQEYVKKSL